MPRKLANPIERAQRALAKGKKPPTRLQEALVERLRVVQAELEETNEGMARRVGSGESSWANWTSLLNMPSIEAMVRLCDKTDVTLDWLYRGKHGGIRVELAIRLEARLKGLDPNTATAAVLLPEEA